MSVSRYFVLRWQRRLAVLMPVVLAAGITSAVVYATPDDEPTQVSAADATPNVDTGSGRPAAEPAHDKAGSSNAVAGGQRGRDSATGGTRPSASAATAAGTATAGKPTTRRATICRTIGGAARPPGFNSDKVCGAPAVAATGKPGTAPVLSVARGSSYEPGRRRRAQPLAPTSTAPKSSPVKPSPTHTAPHPAPTTSGRAAPTNPPSPTRSTPPSRTSLPTAKPSRSTTVTGSTAPRSPNEKNAIKLAAATGPLHQAPVPGSTAGRYQSPNWVSVGGANAPGGVWAGMSAYDPIRNRVISVGGCSTSSLTTCVQQTNTYALDSTGWTKLSPATSPPARAAAAMAWDPVRQQIVMFGGVTSSGTRFNDTWGWNGTTWAQLSVGSTLPSARSHASMAYSPERNGLVLFGGLAAGTTEGPNDTWVLGASGWTKVLASGASGAPTFRHNAMLANLGTSTGGQLVLFGGSACASVGCSNQAPVNDTWVLPASGSWVKQTPTQSPDALQAGVFAYDRQLDANILFGGLGSAGALNKTWAWTGSNWLQAQAGVGSPEARYYAQIAPTSSGALSVFGGVIPARSATAPLDRWSYDAKTPVLGVSVSQPVENTNTYLAGQVVTVKITAQNTGIDNLTSGDATSITAGLNNGSKEILSAVGSAVTFAADPNDPVPGCRSLPAGSTTSAALAGLIPTVSRAAINGGCTATASFLAVVVGSPYGCALQTITAQAGGLSETSTDSRTTLTICGNGLGREDWWTYDSTDLGSEASANVNVANGNLLVKQDDSTVIGSRGDLAFGLSRAYNSQDVLTGNAGQGGVLGTGWQFQIGETGAAANGVSLGSLIVPTLSSVLDPLAVTYVDRDGTRFVFRPKTPSLDDVSGALLKSAKSLTKTGLENLLNLKDNTLGQNLKSIVDSLGGGGPLVCVDTTYTPPPGADMYLYRYLAFGSGSGASGCSSADPSKGVNVGYSLVRPDRIRYDFNLLGQLSDTVDGAGNTLFYTYDAANRPSRIYGGSCVPNGANLPKPEGAVTGDACRQYQFAYSTPSPSGNRIDVTDAAHRVTTYIVEPVNLSSGAPSSLTQVWNPDNPYSATGTPSIRYTYSATNAACPGSDATASTPGQLCSATDFLGAKTTFGYTKAAVGPDRVLSVTDRRANSSEANGGGGGGNMVRYTYGDGVTTADSGTPNTFGTGGTGCNNNAACERVRYGLINSVGSVGEVVQGDATGSLLKQQAFFWDSDTNATPCRQPDAIVDYNLCQTIVRAAPTTSPIVIDKPTTGTVNGVTVADHATRFVYGDLGQVLVTDKIIDPSKAWTASNSAVTTAGARSQYVEAGDEIRAYDDTPRGSGAVDSATTGSSTSYGDSVRADKPSAFYRFAEPVGTNTLADSAGRNQSATYGANVPRGLPAGVPGDTAVGDPGNAATATSQSTADFAMGTGDDSAFTIEAWQQTPRADTSYTVCTPCTGAGLIVGRYNGAPSVNLIGGSGSIRVMANASIADGRWHQVDYAYDGSGKAAGVSIYVDGDRVATTTGANDLSGPFRGGGEGTQFGYNVNGVNGDGVNLSNVALFHSALSAKRVSAHYKAVSNASRADATTLYAVTDQTASLTPRGNDSANASRWGDFVTTYKRDLPDIDPDKSTSAPTPNQRLDGDVCKSTTTNTGLLCATVSPASAGVDKGDCPNVSVGTVGNPPGTAPHTCTTSTYDTFGQMRTKRSAKAHASGANDAMIFTYYEDTGTCSTAAGRVNCDLSGTVSAGGWLKAVTDQAGKSVVTAPDAAGNPARTWDRNAVAGLSLDNPKWTDASSPPSAEFSDKVMANPVTSASISAGADDLEIVRGDGTVWGSGANSQNELGDNASAGGGTATTTPVQAAGLDGVVQVVQNGLAGSGGSYVSTARTTTGAVFSWGANKPVASVGNLPPIISLAAGGGHTLALDNTGTVWAWGDNDSGQLGNNTTGSAVSTPVKITTGVSAIAAGNKSSYAVKTDGSVYVWGLNGAGQLATGDRTVKTGPTKSSGLSKIIAVYAGANTAYAIGTDGSVWSWGDNTAGALGTGTASSSVTAPAKITTLGPASAAGSVRQIVGSISGAAALLSDGSVRAWGLNGSGQLGSGTANSSTPVAVPGVSGQVALSGGANTYVSADVGGKLTIWGKTSSGQKGDGTSPATSGPSGTAAAQNVSPFASPWRYERGGRDPVGNLTTVVSNPNGNVLQSTPARGTAVATSAYDTTATYNASDEPIALLTPQQRDGRDANGALTSVIAATTMAYDTFGNAVTMTDPRGFAVVTKYDAVDRKTETLSTRANEAQAISKCDGGLAVAAAGSFTAKQSGHVICRTSLTYDGNDHGITSTDALKFTTRTTFDGLGRATASATPRSGTQTLTTATNYDRDGNTLDVCPPRQAGGCTSTGVFSAHTAYDPAGRVTASTKYRDSVAKSLVTSMTYDADGNAIAMTDPAGRTTTTTYDLLGRKVSQSRPRGNGVRNTTRWNYDASGNVLAVLAPGAAYPGTGADGALTVDGSNNPKANPFRVPDNAQYTTVTLKNGGWITGQNGGLVFTATGSVTVCESCGITEAGDGQAGGAGGAAGAGAIGNGTAGSTAVSGGKAGNGSGTNAGGGGGGGHKSAGEAGRGGAAVGGVGGAAFGRADFSDIASNYFDAAGGGGGGGGKSGLNPNAAGAGGKGGGFVRVTADTISIDGTVDASGNAGANSSSSSGGGGGGAGGSIWLAAGDVTKGSSAKLDVSGGAGGTTTNMPNGGGGAGAKGYLRIDSDGTPVADADSSGHLANITAYSYDANNRVLDTVLGAQTTDATSVTNAAPDEDGLANTRSRSVYDPDGNVVASLPPQAFSASGGSLVTNTDTAARRDYDLDGNLTTSYDPRYDSTGAADTGVGNDGGQNVNQQKSQCPTGATPSLAPGLKAYASQIGVCVTTVLYDANGNQTKQSLATSTGSDNRYLMRTYTDDGLVQSETSPDPTQPTGPGRVTTGFLYDGVGRLIKTTDPSGAASTTAYFADGLTSEKVDQCYNTADKPTDAPKADCTASGVNITHRTVMTYDPDGHLATQLQPRAQTPTQASTTGLTAADFTTTTTWTSDGLKASVEAPGLGKGDFNKTTYGYDDVGNQVDVGMPSANASTPDASNPGKAHAKYEFTDDDLIRVSSTPVTASTFRNVVYKYNPAGQKVSTDICTTAERDSCPGYVKNADGTIKSPDGRGLTTYTYAPNGLNVLQVAKAHTTTPTTIRTSYDYAGRVKSIKDSSGGGSTVTAGYYLDGLLRTADDGRNANTYAYDGDSHVTNRTDKTSAGGVTGGAVKRTSYSYADSGLMQYMTSDVQTGAKTSVEYDKSGRMSKWSVGGDGKTGQERNYSYFADDRLRAVNTKTTDEEPGKSRLDFAYGYDNDGNITSQVATGTASSNYTNTYGYNPAANTTSFKHVKDGTGTTPTTTTTYAWDHNANRLSAAETKGSATTTQTWKYRVDNSISTQTVEATGAPSLTQNYVYNQAGLLTSLAATPAGGSAKTCVTNDYDDLDRLKKTVTDADPVCGERGSTVAYTYDGTDRQRTQTSTKGSSTTETATIYDGLSKTTTGQSKAGAEDGSKPDNLYQLTPDGKHVAVWEAKSTGSAASLMVDDDNGNTSLLINTTKTGAASTGCTVDYDPFGNPSAPSAATTKPEGACSGGTDAKTTGNAAWYRDERRDATTGDYQLGSRTYDPSNGSFTTPDQYRVSNSETDLGVGADPLTANTYSYVNGNPLNVSDPSGHCPDSSICPSQAKQWQAEKDCSSVGPLCAAFQPPPAARKPAVPLPEGGKAGGGGAKGGKKKGDGNPRSNISRENIQKYVGAIDGCGTAAPDSTKGILQSTGDQAYRTNDCIYRAAFKYLAPKKSRLRAALDLFGLGDVIDCLSGSKGKLDCALSVASDGLTGALKFGKALTLIGGINDLARIQDETAKQLGIGDPYNAPFGNDPDDVSVYYGIRNKQRVYVGISNDPENRQAQHDRNNKGFTLQVIPGLEGLSRPDALKVEQALINNLGGPDPKNNPNIDNKRNNFRFGTPEYDQAIVRGCYILGAKGVPAPNTCV